MDDTLLQSFSMPAGPSPSVAGLELILDAAQAAVLLHCSKEHVETLARRGQLPGVKYGRSWVFLATQLRRQIATDCTRNLEQTVGGAAEPSVRHATVTQEQSPALAPAPTTAEPPAVPRQKRPRPGRPRKDLGTWAPSCLSDPPSSAQTPQQGDAC
jgi:excisionase family DNA binding protein